MNLWSFLWSRKLWVENFSLLNLVSISTHFLIFILMNLNSHAIFHFLIRKWALRNFIIHLVILLNSRRRQLGYCDSILLECWRQRFLKVILTWKQAHAKRLVFLNSQPRMRFDLSESQSFIRIRVQHTRNQILKILWQLSLSFGGVKEPERVSFEHPEDSIFLRSSRPSWLASSH